MKIIDTGVLQPGQPSSDTEKLWTYNGLDVCITLEVLEKTLPLLSNITAATYDFSRELQAPALEMAMRGVKIDKERRDRVIESYQKDIQKLEGNLNRILSEGIGTNLNWKSPQQLKKLFYEVMQIPPVKKRNAKNEYTPTVNREALEKLESYFFAQPIVRHILSLRDIAKKVSVLKTAIDPDGRMRTSYNIAGTETGRFSSNLSDFGTGTNLQNIEERLRSVFVADPGMKFAYIDLEQAESRAVGAIEWNLFHDGRYLDACESGDLHTAVCKLAWTNLPWAGSLKKDKRVAEQPFYREHSYRHMAKVLGHGTNYNGKPFTMSKHTKLESKLIAEFQEKYFSAFPGHRRWHEWTAQRLLEDGFLISLTGRHRWFFGRRNDDSTIREAIAFDPQCTVGDLLNRGMLNVWRLNTCQLLLQIHDAILVQYPEDQEDIILPQLIEAIKVPLELRYGRTLLIPSEAKSGWNWGNIIYNKEGKAVDNLDGLKKYSGHDDRRRPKKIPLLDRWIC